MKLFFPFLICIILGFESLQAQSLPAGMNSAQAIMLAQSASEPQLMAYVQQAKAAGYSLNQVKNLLRAQGASTSELSKLDQLWNKSGNESVEPAQSTPERIRSNFGVNTVTNQTEIQDSPLGFKKLDVKRFGSEFFLRPVLAQPEDDLLQSSNTKKNIKQTSEVPELYIATPDNYELGPGDELEINLYGASETSYTSKITREGSILIDRLGPIFLSGLSIEKAKIQLKNRLSDIYTGLTAPDKDPSKVFLSVNLKNARSIVVNITGQVKSPGTYTISAFTSVLNALYAAGGPNDVGTYRGIRLLRGGEIFKEIDLYQFFVDGKLSTLYLQDQDIIQVPTFKNQVQLSGAFKTEGLFELKENETLEDLMRFSGGIVSGGYKDQVFLSRIVKFKRNAITLKVAEAPLHILKDGDILEANYVRENTENGVTVEGAVYIPGTYSLQSVSTINDLINAAGGTTPEALVGQTILYRRSNGLENEVLTTNLLDPKTLNSSLKAGDRLYINSAAELFDAGSIRIEGEVNSPGIYQYRKGLTISDVIILAQGFTANANKDEVSIYQNVLKNGQTVTRFETVALKDNLIPEKEIEISENALVVVRRDPNFREVEEVSLRGLVLNEGNYALKGNNYRLYDLLIDSGGFLKDAYLKGISIKRRLSGDNSNIIESSLLEAIEGSADKEASKSLIAEQKERVSREIQSESVIIGIDGDRLMASGGSDLRENVILQSGDIITVPRLDNTITVIGDIQKRSKFVYDERISLKEAIRLSGGYNQTAKRSKVYVIYKNGTIKSRRRILGLFSIHPRLEPGATVVVPERLVREGGGPSLGEIVGLSSSLATLVLLLQQLGL